MGRRKFERDRCSDGEMGQFCNKDSEMCQYLCPKCNRVANVNAILVILSYPFHGQKTAIRQSLIK